MSLVNSQVKMKVEMRNNTLTSLTAKRSPPNRFSSQRISLMKNLISWVLENQEENPRFKSHCLRSNPKRLSPRKLLKLRGGRQQWEALTTSSSIIKLLICWKPKKMPGTTMLPIKKNGATKKCHLSIRKKTSKRMRT